MLGLVFVTVMLINDFEWWWKYRQLRLEARESAERLIDILNLYIDENRRPMYSIVL